MSWVKLDDGFPDHPKVIGLTAAARWAFIDSICYCARQLTDGHIPRGKYLGFSKGIRGELMDAGLWELSEEEGVIVHDYLDYNPTREEVLAERLVKHEAKVRAGKAGAAKRWQGDSSGIAEGVADRMAKGWQKDGPVPPPLPLPDPVLEKPTVSNQGGGGRANIFILYEQVFGPMHGGVVEELGAIEDEYPPACVEHCFKAAQDLVPRPKSLGWVKAMLGRHQRDGCDKAAARKVAEPALKGRYD